MLSKGRRLVQENEGFVGEKGMIVQKTADMKFFLNSRLCGLKNTRTFVLKE